MLAYSITHRLTFDVPGPDDTIAGVATLTPLDLALGKLLALADHRRDDSRDLIDLAVMLPARPLLRAAIDKASAACGDGVENSLASAVHDLRERPQRLDACM